MLNDTVAKLQSGLNPATIVSKVTDSDKFMAIKQWCNTRLSHIYDLTGTITNSCDTIINNVSEAGTLTFQTEAEAKVFRENLKDKFVVDGDGVIHQLYATEQGISLWAGDHYQMLLSSIDGINYTVTDEYERIKLETFADVTEDISLSSANLIEYIGGLTESMSSGSDTISGYLSKGMLSSQESIQSFADDVSRAGSDNYVSAALSKVLSMCQQVSAAGDDSKTDAEQGYKFSISDDYKSVETTDFLSSVWSYVGTATSIISSVLLIAGHPILAGLGMLINGAISLFTSITEKVEETTKPSFGDGSSPLFADGLIININHTNQSYPTNLCGAELSLPWGKILFEPPAGEAANDRVISNKTRLIIFPSVIRTNCYPLASQRLKDDEGYYYSQVSVDLTAPDDFSEAAYYQASRDSGDYHDDLTKRASGIVDDESLVTTILYNLSCCIYFVCDLMVHNGCRVFSAAHSALVSPYYMATELGWALSEIGPTVEHDSYDSMLTSVKRGALTSLALTRDGYLVADETMFNVLGRSFLRNNDRLWEDLTSLLSHELNVSWDTEQGYVPADAYSEMFSVPFNDLLAFSSGASSPIHRSAAAGMLNEIFLKGINGDPFFFYDVKINPETATTETDCFYHPFALCGDNPHTDKHPLVTPPQFTKGSIIRALIIGAAVTATTVVASVVLKKTLRKRRMRKAVLAERRLLNAQDELLANPKDPEVMKNYYKASRKYSRIARRTGYSSNSVGTFNCFSNEACESAQRQLMDLTYSQGASEVNSNDLQYVIRIIEG